jgi:hypothetical protein
MFFNYDSFELGAISFVVLGILTTYSFYNSSAPINNNESLVNTLSKLDSNVQLDNLPSHGFVDATVQTEVVNTSYVNTGMQTSSRMWLESIKNWINEILSSSTSNPSVVEGYVDVGVQTNGPSMWETVKDFFLQTFSVRPSDLTSIGHNKVEKWRNYLDSVQSVDLHDSESPLTSMAFGSPINSTLDKLVDPDESASNISEIVSEAHLQNVESSTRFYDMNNPADVLDLMNDPTVVFGINGAYDPADDLITFITPDASYEILRSTLDTLLISVN